MNPFFKTTCFLFCILLQNQLLSQPEWGDIPYESPVRKPIGVKIIDRNEANYEALFNPNNPQSLLGILVQNTVPLPQFANEQTINRIRLAEPGIIFYEHEGPQATRPLTTRPDSSGKVTDSLIQINGVYCYAYPPTSKDYYELSNISRLILYLDTVQNEETHEKYIGISRIGLAKKYASSDKYDIVLSFSFSAFARMSQYELIVKANDRLNAKLTDSKSYYRNAFKDSCLHLRTENLSHFPGYYFFPGYYVPTSHDPIIFPRMFVAEHLFHYGSSGFGIHRINFEFSDSKKDTLHNYFDVLKIIPGPESDLPITDQYGNDSTVIYPDGTICFIYPPRDSVVTWVETEPIRVYIHYLMERDKMGKKCFRAKTFYFTTETKGYNIPFLAFSLGTNKALDVRLGWDDFQDDIFQSKIETSGMEWFKFINAETPVLNTKVKGDIHYLFEQFYLEKDGNNLLNLPFH
ncbi:hypothetical protein D3C71_441270 [compost metagenome]